MIKQALSFGLFMLVENTVTLTLLADLIIRVGKKLNFVRHPHLFWTSGMVLQAFLLIMFLVNLLEFALCYDSYLMSDGPIDFWKVVARVLIRSMMCLATILLWYYSVLGGFNLFKDKK